MNQVVTKAIILGRTDYGEADRILTLLTPHEGKLRLLAKGVRKIKSKLAGGIELFSVSTITFVRGKGDIGTLISTRLDTHFGHIVENLDRTMFGYECLKRLHKITEDQPEPDYFELLEQLFKALDDATVALPFIRFWFAAQLLRLGGHSPNLQTDDQGYTLKADQTYHFNFDTMAFNPGPHGRFTSDHIKFLRLTYAGHEPALLAKVQGGEALVSECGPLTTTMLQTHLHV